MSLVDFFFSSRRRHTRLQGDWSSDVCSSDLLLDVEEATGTDVREKDVRTVEDADGQAAILGYGQIADFDLVGAIRPLADPERAHPLQAGDRHPVAGLADQPQPVLAVDDHVLPIVPG